MSEELQRAEPNRLSAYDAAAVNSAAKEQAISFGMDSKSTADWLRGLADRIEKREFILQGCTVLTRAKLDEFVMTFVRLQLHERLPIKEMTTT